MKARKITILLTSTWPALVLIAWVTVVIYSNIYCTPFVFDGTYQIEKKTEIRDLNRFLSPTIFYSPRPLGELTFALNYRFGGLNVFGYHVVNILIHIINGFLVYFLASAVFRRLCASTFQSSIPAMSLFAALVFVAHPLQTQAVTYTVQRYTSLAAMFYFLSILFYIKGRTVLEVAGGREQGPESREPAEGHRAKAANAIGHQPRAIRYAPSACFALSFLCALLAFLSKQNTASLPATILLVEYLLFDRTWQGWKRKLVWLAPAFVLMGLFILYASGMFRGGVQFGRLLEDVSAILKAPETVVDRWTYFCTQLNVIVIYIRLLFLPVGQNLDYMYPFKTGFFDGYTPAAFLFLAALIGLGVWNIKKRPEVAFGIFWFLITVSVESSIFPINDAVFEHRLYLPMFGFALVVVYGTFRLLGDRQAWAMVLLTFVVISLGSAAYLRNRIYGDKITLWADVVSKSPNNFRAYYNLGNALYYSGHPDEAMKNYAEALRIRGDFAEAHNNLGVALLHNGRTDDALRHISEANRIKPRDPEIRNNLGEVLIKRGQLREAVQHLREAIRLTPGFAEAHNNLGIALAQMGKLDEGIRHFTQAVRADPRNVRIHINLGQALLLQGRLQEAAAAFSAAIRIEPACAEARQGLQRAKYRGIREQRPISSSNDIPRPTPGLDLPAGFP